MENKKNKIIILLTATVNPNGMINTKLQDPIIRKEQYIEAVKYYLNNSIYSIVLCENSNYNFDELKSKYYKDRLEILTFKGNNFPKIYGKSFGEIEIIEYALNNSKFLQQTNCFCKITGRVKITNINQIIEKAQARISLKKEIFCGNLLFYDTILSVCYIVTKDWFKEKITILKEILIKNPTKEMEQIIYKTVFNSKNLKFYSVFPEISGICGSFNTKYVNVPFPQRQLEHYAILSKFYKNGHKYIHYLTIKLKWSFYVLIWKLYGGTDFWSNIDEQGIQKHLI